MLFRGALSAFNISKYSKTNLAIAEWSTYYETYPLAIPPNNTGLPIPQNIEM